MKLTNFAILKTNFVCTYLRKLFAFNFTPGLSHRRNKNLNKKTHQVKV